MALDSLVEFLTQNPAKKPTVYVCGPMRGIKCLNFSMFNKVTALLRRSGFHVISPAENDRLAKVPWVSQSDPDWADETYTLTKQQLRETLRRDMESIVSLRVEDGDFLVLLPGWRKSTGGFAEVANARWVMLPTREIQFFDSGEVSFQEISEADWGAKANMVADPYFPGRN